MMLNGSSRPSHGWRVGLGLLTVGTGMLVLVWPHAAVVTVAIIVGIHLTVAGAVSLAAVVLVLAYATPSAHTMIGLFGLALIAVGLTMFVGAAADARAALRHG